jgi:Helix-turn-helix domain
VSQFSAIPEPTLERAIAVGVGARAFKLLAVICLYVNDKGEAWPGLDTLSAKTRIPRQDLPRVVKELVRAGLVDRVSGGHRGDRGQRSNLYRIVRLESVCSTADCSTADCSAAQKESAPEQTKLPRNNPSSEERSSSESPARQIAKMMVAVWNDECGDILRTVAKIGSDRVKACAGRWRDSFDRDLDRWRAHCRAIRSTPFVCGAGERGWRADLDWALKPKSIIAIQEGKYLDAAPPQQQHRRGEPFSEIEVGRQVKEEMIQEGWR